MQEQGKSRKPLIIGIVAAVVILAVLLVLLLTQCTGGGAGATTTPGTTAETEAPVPTYQLYWNADRAEYDGKSEAGMSSRMPEADGYFHVRFILDGEEVILKVADRKLINSIDVKDLMGLEFDENGIVVGVVSIDDMPLEKLGWQFYVQSAASSMIKLNSSEGMNGMEVLLEIDKETGIYDMSGKSGPVGTVDDPIPMDRVYAVANLAGEVTHVFIYQRPNYMLTHEAECQHCKKTVTWYEWVKTDAMPLTTGHYQLQNDIQLNGQPAQQEDAKVCIDLNGKRVDGKAGSRCYAMFNAGTELAIMDTSEEQTGVMAAHGKGDQGMVVWVRYGAFYLYGGTLDASDATTKISGTAVECGKGKYFYMFGGTIIGGTAEPQQNDKGNWTAGLGGTLAIGGKFVMHDGEIRNGNAKAHVTWKNGEPSYSRGFGGNIFLYSGSVMEMNGGTIKNGKAGNVGGNIYMDGTAELTINGGVISGGTLTGKGRNGGNIYMGAKGLVTQNGGSIIYGTVRNCGGNVYLNGKYVMNGGFIGNGRVLDFKTGKKVENAASANVFIVNGQFQMYGGKVAGYVQAIDTDAKKTDTQVVLSGYATIDGGEECTRNLTLSQGGSNITVRVGNLRDKARIGVHATTGYFTLPTKEENKDNFFSDIEGAEILYHDSRLALGRLQCICGSNSDNVEDHLGACKAAGGEKVVFAPWTSSGSMPNAAGNYYLLAESLSVGNTAIVTPGDGKGTDVVINVDLNGKEIVSKNGRFYSLFENKVAQNEDGTWAGNIADEHIELSLSDSVGTAKVTLNARASSDMGYLIWGRYNDSKITIYGGTYDGSAVSVDKHNGAIISTSGELNIHAGTFDGGNSVSGGIIAVQGSKAVLNMTGGVIKNGTARAGGGNVFLNSGATFNLSGGSILDGSCNKDGTLVGDLAYGGNIDLANGKLNMTGGEIAGGVAYIGLKGEAADGTPISAGGGLGGNIRVGNGTATLTGGVIRDGIATTGGNIGTNNGNATIILDGVQLLDGHATSSGGNLAVNVRAPKLIEIKGDTLVSGGTANGNGGNIYLNSWVSNGKSVTLNILGGTIADGSSGNPGGNIYSYSSTPEKNMITMDGGTISGGKVTGLESNGNRKNGGSVYIPGNTEFILNGGTVTGGGNAKQGGNFYLNGKTSTLTVNGGEILNGSTNDCGGNVQLQGNALLVVNGGKILDGHHDNGATGTSNNVYAVNSRIEMTGGEINGLAATNTTANGCSVKISGDAVVSPSKSNNGLGIGCWSSGTVNFDPPFVQLGELSDKASIAWSTAGFVTTETSEANLDNCTTTLPEASVHYVDGRIFVGQYACICGGTSELGPCAEGGHKKVTWLPWNGTSNLTKDGNYYLYQDVNKTSQRALGKEGLAYNVNLNLNGHKITNSFRVFQLWDTATLSIADHKGGGALLTNGNTTDNYGGIQMLGKLGTVHFYSGKIGFAEGYKNHKEIALIESSGTFNMYGGEIFGGENPTGTLVNVGGTFNMYAGTVRDGNNTTINTGSAARGGNFRVSGTLNVYGGTITGGKALFGGNIAGTGKVNILGGTVTDGIGQASDAEYTRGGNIYMTGANAQLVVSGKDTVISGGTLVASPSKGWMPGGSIYADGGATITVEGGATVIGGDGQDGNNIYITSDNTKVFLKDCTIKNTVDGAGNIMVERGSVTIDGAQIINTANGYNLRANEGGKIANFTFNSGLITGGKPNVMLGGDDTFVMNGGTIENGESANYGGNISLTSSKFTLNDGVITGGVAAKEGGNICMSGTAELIVNGGEISKGTANAGSGGNIIVWDSSSVTLNDGVISGGTCTGNGGNISLSGKTTMTVNGGKVIEGESGDSAGNIAVYGKLTVNGGEILDGKCKNSGNGMNISVVATSADTAAQAHELVITGGKIGGGVHFNNYKGNTAIVSISGSPVIDKALSTKVTPTYSMKLGSNDLTIGQLTDGAKIVVSGEEGVFSYKAPEGSAKFFESEVEGLAVFQTADDELVLVYGKQGCICGNVDGTHIGECDGTTHDWIPVTAMPETSGYYYLISDVTDSGSQRILTSAQNIVLDLNGHTVTSNKWRMYRFDTAGCSLTITDNSKEHNGKILVPANRDQGSVVWFFSGASNFAMYNGTIDVSAAKNGSGSSGLAIAGGGGSVVKLFRGTIKGGSYADNNWGGSAVAMEGGKTHFLGNVEITGEGSALYIGDGSKVDMTHVTKAPETPWAIDASGIFTKGWNKEWKIEDYFTSASAYGCQIYLDEATGELKMGIMDCACRQATCVGDCDGKDIFWQPYRTTSNMPTAAGNYFLTRNISGVGQKNITGDTKTVVRIDLNGKSVTVNAGSRLYLLQKTNELHVTDSVGTGTIIGGGHSANGGIFLPQGTSVLKIYAGNYTLRSDATPTPNGGWIDASSNGVSIFGGNFTASVNGGNLIVVRDNLTMNISGGTFTNTANSAKGQTTVGVWTGATLNISGGTFTTTGENQRSIVTDGTVNMSGGTVKGGYLTVIENGANILINTKGTFNLSGGLVTGGNSANQGGNICVYGKLYISGGTVKDGVSKANAGHNIAVISPNADTKAVVEISGGKIAGGVYFNCYYTTPTVKLSGKPTIDKALTSADAGAKPTYGMEVPASFDLDLTGLTGGEIHVKGAEPGQFAFNATEAMVDYFVSETYEGSTQLPVCYDNGGLCFGKVYCLCGASETGGTHSQGCLAVNGGKELIWLPADSTDDLMAGGNFYLTKSFTTGMISLSKNTVIDLNGYTLSKADGQRIVSYYGSTDVTLTVTDATSAKKGGMIVSGSKTNQGGLFWLAGTNSKLNLVAGTFDASGYTVSASGGGRSGAGIDAASTSEINIYEGVTLKGGTVTHGNTTNGASGGAIATTGKLNIFGGTISGGKAHSGGNIYGGGSSTITISGGTISGGTATGEKITVGEETKEVYGLGGNIRADGVLTISDGTIEKGSATYGETSGWVAGGNLYVAKTVTISGGTITGGTSSSQGGNIYANGSARITMSGGTVEKGTGVHGSGFYLDKGAQLTMSNGKIIDNTATGNGGNIALIGASKLTVTGGQISGGTAANGGNIYMEANSGNNPTVDIQNITVSGGTAANGGNLYIKAGTASFTGATITGGTANNPTGYGQGGNLYTAGGTVNLNAGTTMSGGTLVNGNGKSWTPGANGYLNGGTVNIKGTVSSAGGASQGHNFYVNGKTIVNVDGGKIECTGENAESVYIRSGTLNIKNNGQLTSTGKNCRNILTNDEAAQGEVQINLQSGKISGGNVTGEGANGGSIHLTSKATMTITGGEITGGTASNGGGLIANYGTLNISGGKLYGGKAVDSIRSNIYSQGNVNISGGEVWGGLTMHNLGKANLTVSGAAVINGKLNATEIPGITFWGYQSNPVKPLTISGKLTGTACIGINMSDWVFAVANANNKDSVKAFYADNGVQNIYQLDDTSLYIGQVHCICGKLDGSHATYTDASGKTVGCDGTELTWKATSTLPTTSGNYYLTRDLTVEATAEIKDSANVVLDLNGKTVTVNATRMYTLTSGTLTVTNTVKGKGGIVSANTAASSGSFVSIAKSTTANLYGVDVSMTGTTASGQFAGLIDVSGTLNVFGDTVIRDGKTGSSTCAGNLRINGGAILNMFDGTIKNGKATNAGFNIQCWGTINMYGDALITNTYSADSANIQLAGNNAVLNMYGGKITGDSTTYQTPTINLCGNAQITKGVNCGMYLADPSVVINVTGKLTGAEPIAVNVKNVPTNDAPVTFAKGNGITLGYADKAWFTSAQGYQVGLAEDGSLFMLPADAHMHCVCGGELAEDETHTCVDIIYTAMTANDWKFYSDTDKTAAVNGNYYLTGDLNMGSNMINLRHGSQVNICLNGHTLTSNTRTVSMFCDGTDGTNCGSHKGETTFVATPVLNLASCQDGGVVASNNATAENGRVLWARLGNINCYGITIDATKSTKQNGTSTGHTGIAVQTTSADATLYNCVVKGGIDESLANNDSFGAAMSVNGKGTLALVGTFELQTADKAIGLYVADGSKLDVSRLESVNAPISVSASGVFTEGLDKTELKLDELFTSFISGMDLFTSVNTEAGEAFFGKVSCLCGSTTDEHIGECDGSRVELAAWRAKGSMPRATGNYILTSGAVKTGRNTPNDGAKIVVNLNGQTVTGTDRIYTPLFIDGNSGYQCKSATLNIVNGTMISAKSGDQGGVFWMGNNTTVSLYNVTVDARGRSANGSGTVADTAANSVFNMFGNTTLYGGTTANNGGTMAISGQLNMWDDSKIIGGTTTVNSSGGNTTGGALYVRHTNAVVTMNDNAIIQDGISQNNGGNVYIAAGKLVMNDNAQILNGKACNISGNIQVASGQTLEMHGGKISGGVTGYNTETKTGSSDANSSNGTILNNANLIMTGGEIEGRINAFAYSAGCSPKITLSGDAKISGGTFGLRMTIDKGDLFTITIGEGGLTNGANIVITNGTPSVLVSGTTIVTNVSSSDVAYISGVAFLYDNTEKIITLK